MRRRSKAGTPTNKTRRRKTATFKRRDGSKPAPARRPAASADKTRVARLARDLKEALRQQTATFEVLEVISGSTFDLQSVLNRLVASAMHLCNAHAANIWLLESGVLRLAASCGHSSEFKEFAAQNPITPGRGTVSGRVIIEGETVHIPDVLADPEFRGHGYQSRGNYRSHLGVPLLREAETIGAFALTRKEVMPYSEQQIALVQTFASQAVIAIANARLLEMEQKRTRELRELVTLLNRERENKLMNLEAMAASIGHEVRQPLSGIASNGNAALRFLAQMPPNLKEAQAALNRMVRDSHRASEVFDNIRTLFGTSDRGREPVDVNELVRGALRDLAEELKSHGVAIKVDLSAQLPPIPGHRGQLQEVFINLIHNAVEAMDAVEAGQRLLQIRSQRTGSDSVTVAVEDSGPGISATQLENIFNAFVTTKPQGMGLGLAICRMIIERHEGRLSAAPAQPRGSVFKVVLPVASPATA